MIRRKTFVILASGVAMIAVATGCRPKKQPAPMTPQEAQSQAIDDTRARMTELQRRSQDLGGVVQQLPGRDASEDRQLVAQAFDAMSDSLRMMGGSEPGGALDQQLGIIENVRRFLRSGDAKLSYEPAVDAGLRATHNALDGVGQQLFANDPNVRTKVNALGERLTELDHVRGPMHSVVVAQVFQSAADAIGTMSNTLGAREEQMAQPVVPQQPAYPQPGDPQQPAAQPGYGQQPTSPQQQPAYPQQPAAVAAPAAMRTPPPAAAAPVAPAPAPAAAAQPQGPTAEEYQRLQQQMLQQQQQLQQLQLQLRQQQQLLQRQQQLQPQQQQSAPAPGSYNK